jgi:hypothetical protein
LGFYNIKHTESEFTEKSTKENEEYKEIYSSKKVSNLFAK